MIWIKKPQIGKCLIKMDQKIHIEFEPTLNNNINSNK